MQIFVSYRATDLPIVQGLERHLADFDLDYWDHSSIPGKPDWDSIEQWIGDADVVVLVVTADTLAQAISVGQEVGIARAQEKVIIPLVAHDISPSRLGFLKGTTALRFDPDSPEAAFERLADVLSEIRRGNRLEGLLVGGLAVAGLAWLASLPRNPNPPGNQYL